MMTREEREEVTRMLELAEKNDASYVVNLLTRELIGYKKPIEREVAEAVPTAWAEYDDAELRELLRQKNKLGWINKFRSTATALYGTYIGLKESKEICDKRYAELY